VYLSSSATDVPQETTGRKSWRRDSGWTCGDDGCPLEALFGHTREGANAGSRGPRWKQTAPKVSAPTTKAEDGETTPVHSDADDPRPDITYYFIYDGCGARNGVKDISSEASQQTADGLKKT